jgi:hypothetical protein
MAIRKTMRSIASRVPHAIRRGSACGLLLWALFSHPALAQGRDIVLPVDVSGAGGEVAVEIDGSDLTEFVRIEGDQLVVLASAALAPGRHEAVVYVLSGDSYQVFATYSFDVAASADPQTTVTVTAAHEVGVLAVNDATEGHVASTGTVNVETVDQSMTARLSYVIDSRDENQIGDRFANIAEYSIELHQTGPLLDLTGRIGHQSLGFDRALIADLNRRGLSVEGTGPGERLQFHLFALKSSEAVGAENLLGISAEDDRMLGGRVAFRPFVGSDFRLSLQTYEGEGAPDFSLITGVGSGQAIGIDGSLAEGRLRYDLSIATARWDGDGNGVLPEDKADAVLGALAYDLEPANGAVLTLGLEYEQTDLFYFSLANPGLPTGGETVRFTSDYAAERLTLYGAVEATLTNQGGDPLDPVDRVTKLALDGSWAIYDAGFLTDATLTFGASTEEIRRVETPPGAPGPENWSGLSAYVGVEKYGDAAGWSLIYTYLDEDDDGPGNFDLTGHEIAATLDLSPSDRLTISTTALAGAYESAFSGEYDRFEGDISLDYALDPGVWALSLDLGVSATNELGIDDGAYAAALLTRSLSNGSELIVNAGWYNGTYAEVTGLQEETIIGLTYRVRSELAR